MPAQFPTLRSGTLRLPLTRSKTYKTAVLRFMNGSEQRWRSVGALVPFQLEYQHLNGYDLGLLREFFRSTKGAFDSSWSLTFNGTTYNNLAFDQDDFTPTETREGVFSITLKIRQTKR
jgi:hypothetical protein